MKLMPSIVFAGVLGTVLASGSLAGAQPSAQRTPSATGTTTTTKTAEYTEQSVGGDQVVTFVGDELAGLENPAYGTSIRPLPGVTRVGLIRPRVNFVSELLKSVENL